MTTNLVKTIDRIPARTAATTLLVLTAGVVVFHLLIVTQVLPYSIVWGGRLTSYSEMIRFESVSIALNFLIAALAAMAGGFIPNILPTNILKLLLWALFVILVFNTIANPFSATLFEAVVFTPVTFVMAVCFYRLILSRRP